MGYFYVQLEEKIVVTWNNGYVSDIDYTFGYYSELSPDKLKLALALAGLEPINVRFACELGIGQGVTTNIHAAASEIKWYGNDFNPNQAMYASRLASKSGNGFQVSDEAFDVFCNDETLPDFDFIALHGIWSWVSAENRQVIVDFIRRKLRVGGVLYISYNTFPGWANFAPMRHILTQHSKAFSAAAADMPSKIADALRFGQELLAMNPRYLSQHPAVSEQLNSAKDKNIRYLAHEYFNKDWDPTYFSDIASQLSDAKLEFATSAHYLDLVDAINMTKQQATYLKSLKDVNFRQSVRDFIVNQQFRRDYWIKGARRLTPMEKTELLRDVDIILTRNRSHVPETFKSPLGDVTLDKSVYGPILNCLSGNSITKIGSIADELKAKDINLNMVTEAISILVGIGCVAPVFESGLEHLESCKILNNTIIETSKSRNEIEYLVSPVFSGGIKVPRIDMLIIGKLLEGNKSENNIAREIAELFVNQGSTLSRTDGTMLSTIDEIREEIQTRIKQFVQETKPLLKKLQIM